MSATKTYIQAVTIYYQNDQKLECEFITSFLRYVGVLVHRTQHKKSIPKSMMSKSIVDVNIDLTSMRETIFRDFHYDAWDKNVPLKQKKAYKSLDEFIRYLWRDDEDIKILKEIAEMYVNADLFAMYYKDFIIENPRNYEKYTLIVMEPLIDIYKRMRALEKEYEQNVYFAYFFCYIRYLINFSQVNYIENKRQPYTANYDRLAFDTLDMIKIIRKCLEKFPYFGNFIYLESLFAGLTSRYFYDKEFYLKEFLEYLNQYTDSIEYKILVIRKILPSVKEKRDNKETAKNWVKVVDKYKDKTDNFKFYYKLACNYKRCEPGYEKMLYSYEMSANLIGKDFTYLSPKEQIYLYKNIREIGIIYVKFYKEKSKYINLDKKYKKEKLPTTLEGLNLADNKFKEAENMFKNLEKSIFFKKLFPEEDRQHWINLQKEKFDMTQLYVDKREIKVELSRRK